MSSAFRSSSVNRNAPPTNHVRSGRLNVKRSLGTALKFWGKDGWANASVYAKLGVLSLLAVGDPMLMNHFGYEPRIGTQTAQQFLDHALELAGVQKPTGPNQQPLQR